MMVYSLTVPAKFLMFYQKLTKACAGMKLIVSRLKESSIQRAREDENGLKTGAKILGIVLLSFLFPYLYSILSDTQNLVEIIASVISIPSIFALDFTNVLLQFVYLNFCIQICSLFKQLEDDLHELITQNDGAEFREKVGKVSEFHDEILHTISDLGDNFNNILRLNFVVNIWLVAQTLIFSSESKWLELLTSSPFLLLEAWIFCYGSQMIISKVKKEFHKKESPENFTISRLKKPHPSFIAWTGTNWRRTRQKSWC